MKITKLKTQIWFTEIELVMITLAAVTAILAAFMVGRYIGIDAAIKSASYYSDGVDERGAFYELEFLDGSRVDRYYWKEEQ